MQRAAVLLFFLFSWSGVFSQELDCTVKINIQKLQTADPRIFETLEQAISEFMNNTKWSEDVFDPQERIKCNLLLTLQEELSPTSFRAELAVQSSRPVFGSSYETVLLNHIDNEIIFTYEQYQPLIFSRNSYNNNLSSVLSFYAFVILGLDYDSFSLYGGEQYFQSAQEVVNTVPQAAAGPGWSPTGSDVNRNRFWVVENYLSPRVRPMREAMYAYHRLALDIMYQDVAKGRGIMADAMENILKVNQTYPNSVAVIIFINAKNQEVMEIFKMGTPKEKEQAVRVMSRIDGANASRYRILN